MVKIAKQTAFRRVAELAKKGLVYVDQGMDHGHFELKLSSEDVALMARYLHILDPKLEIKVEPLFSATI